jgi:hypothetical protein
MSKHHTRAAMATVFISVLVATSFGVGPAIAAPTPTVPDQTYVLLGDIPEISPGSNTYALSTVQKAARAATIAAAAPEEEPGAQPVGPDAYPIDVDLPPEPDASSTMSTTLDGSTFLRTASMATSSSISMSNVLAESGTNGASTMAASYSWTRMANGSWRDGRNAVVQVRQGDYSWGYAHAQRHNVTMNMIRALSKYPASRTVQGSAIKYEGTARFVTCPNYRPCYVAKTMPMRMIHEGKLASDGYPRGLITYYCVGPAACPDWVKRLV